MPDAASAPVTDAFVSLEPGDGTEFGAWIEHLANADNRKGLVRITIEAFHGRSGWKEIAELPGCSQEDGKPVSAPGDVAHFVAATVARSAYQLAIRHHKREAIERYRLVCWHCKKKGGEGHRGEVRAIVIAKEGTFDVGSHDGDANVALLKILAQSNTELRGMVKDLLDSQVQMSQANAATMLNNLEVSKVIATERLELADRASRMNTRATPQDWNFRWESAMKHVGEPLGKLIGFLTPPTGFRPGSPGWGNGGAPPGGSGGSSASSSSGGASSSADASSSGSQTIDDSQKRAQAFLDGVTSEQADALRDGLGAECWSTICAVIRGDPGDWITERPVLAQILQANAMLLMRVLSREQIATLQGFAE